MVEESNMGCVVNVAKWLRENEENFKPPVCNSIMAGGFLKIMFVGGPNVRKDYHLDQGEEFFYMIKGDMCLKVIERGEPKDIHIQQGEVFVLPSRIPHSPQRKENTLGLVIERERSHQWDAVRYYCDDEKTILWQKYFHLQSLVKDFPPVIKEFFTSEQHKTGKPIPGTTDEEEEKIKVDVDTVLPKPISLDEWVSINIASDNTNDGKLLFGKGEFKILVYGQGSHNLQSTNETWLWMKKGNGTCEVEGKLSQLSKEDALIIPADKKFVLTIVHNGSYCMSFTMDPNATPQQ